MSATGTKQTSMPTLSMSAFGGKADIPVSTTRQVSLQFSQRGFLPRPSYDSMPGKEVLMAENSIRPARWGVPGLLARFRHDRAPVVCKSVLETANPNQQSLYFRHLLAERVSA